MNLLLLIFLSGINAMDLHRRTRDLAGQNRLTNTILHRHYGQPSNMVMSYDMQILQNLVKSKTLNRKTAMQWRKKLHQIRKKNKNGKHRKRASKYGRWFMRKSMS